MTDFTHTEVIPLPIRPAPGSAAAPTPELEQPISEAYPAIDTDLARDNMENDFPWEDRQDL